MKEHSKAEKHTHGNKREDKRAQQPLDHRSNGRDASKVEGEGNPVHFK